MASSNSIIVSALAVSAAAAAFCLLAGNGSTSSICFTSGCRLFEDSSIAGVSFYTIGVAGFGVLALLALLGKAQAGRALALLALLLDIVLLGIMVFTAPCINCLIVAVFAVTSYLCFRRATHEQGYSTARKQPKSSAAIVWTVLFLINVVAVVRAEVSVWSITDNADSSSIRVYYSPSCPSCRQAIAALSGRVDVAFFPVAEDDSDIACIAAMKRSLNEGASMQQALQAGLAAPQAGLIELFTPDMLLLKFRLLRNMAHVYAAGSQSIPFIEYQGLPGFLTQAKQESQAKPQAATPRRRNPVPLTTEGDDTLPIDMSIWGACSASEHCEDAETFNRPGKR